MSAHLPSRDGRRHGGWATLAVGVALNLVYSATAVIVLLCAWRDMAHDKRWQE